MIIHDAFSRPSARAQNIPPRKTIVTNGYINARIDATAGSVRERNFYDRRNVIFSNKPLTAKRQTFYYRHNQHYQATTIRLRDLHRFDDAASRMHFTRRYSSNSGNVCGIAETKTTISFNVTIVEKDR
ncbi:PREDICTED: uncharacterized protein LOC108765589 [Trachymyrmex cornetzi]|uniref:uncharacterized protein LOC108765589 n=1 Tax=Trachymyrmex cornetzi TaxID=471704 RepID=UPI00084F1CB5|nr:PREDICTED: uncharacterized protein LOC108765589 [Trachymyrmex cornetzi]